MSIIIFGIVIYKAFQYKSKF